MAIRLFINVMEINRVRFIVHHYRKVS